MHRDWLRLGEEAITICSFDLRPLWLEKVETPEASIKLAKSIKVLRSLQNGKAVFEVPELNLVCSGSTWNEATQALCADIVWLWKEYAMVADDELSADAKVLKDRLCQIVKEVVLRN